MFDVSPGEMLFSLPGGAVASGRCFQIIPRFGEYSRPRTLSSGDVVGVDVDDGGGGGDGSGGGGGDGCGGGGGGDYVTNPTLARLATALKSHMDKVYSSEVLRCLQRRMPVTLPALQNVWTCLESMPTEEVTQFLVRGFVFRSICVGGTYVPSGRRGCRGRQKGVGAEEVRDEGVRSYVLPPIFWSI